MSSTLKSSFSIASLIETTKTSSDPSSRDPIVTSASTASPVFPGYVADQDHVWNTAYLTPHGMMPHINSALSAYSYHMMLPLAGSDTTPPTSPTLQMTFLDPATSQPHTPGSSPKVAMVRTPPANNTLSPDTSAESEGHSGSSTPDDPLRKNGRMSYSAAHVARLESVFLTTPYPDSQLYENLSEELGLPAKKLKVWFQNKRARSKRRGSDVRMTSFPAAHPVYMPVMPSIPSAVPPYPYMMPGVMMTQPSVMMTPPSSPLEMQMQHQYLTFPTSTPMIPPVQRHYVASAH